MEKDYKKMYEDAIKRAMNLALANNISALDAGKIFPELLESADEKIRMAQLNYWRSVGGKEWYGVPVQEVIAWLEKQGEQKHKIQPKFKIGDIIRFKGNETLKGEAETHKIVGYDNELYVFADGTTDLFCEQDLYELVEQKPTVNVGPKFKVGDWVVQGCSILNIRCVGDEYYCFETVGGYVDDMLVSEIDSLYHLWTIQDAKNGDVLTTDTWTFIFKKYQDKSVYYHCAASTFNDFSISDTGEFDSNYVHPATKEQRDLLFQKMREAGYEWDSEKKELKKIEQNSSWSEEDEKHINLILRVLDIQQCWDGKTGKKFNPYQSEIAWLKSIKDRVQPKQEWSEYDKIQLSEAIQMIEANGTWIRSEDAVKKVSNWLKSIKPTHWKPSDEQMNELRRVAFHFGNSSLSPHFDKNKELVSLYNDLKKL